MAVSTEDALFIQSTVSLSRESVAAGIPAKEVKVGVNWNRMRV